MSAFTTFDHACHRLAKLPEGWRGNLFTRVGGDFKTGQPSQGVLVLGAVSPPFLRGPRKDEPNWKKRDRATEREIFVPHEEFRKSEAEIAKERDGGGLC